jgi:hypothetical protein
MRLERPMFAQISGVSCETAPGTSVAMDEAQEV